MNRPTREEVADRTIDRLRRLTEQLERREPIPVTVVGVWQVADGEVVTREQMTLEEWVDGQHEIGGEG